MRVERELSQVRQQYHFRQTPAGLFVWDVNRLIELAKSHSPFEKPLDEISELNEAYWFDEHDKVTCEDVIIHAKLIDAANLSYPIILCHEGRVMDGMHRVCKARILDMKTIRAVQFIQPIKPHYVDVAPEELPY